MAGPDHCVDARNLLLELADNGDQEISLGSGQKGRARHSGALALVAQRRESRRLSDYLPRPHIALSTG